MIEPHVLKKMFGQETFFSLFYELDAIYNYVNASIRDGSFSIVLGSEEESISLIRTLGYVLDRPSPVNVKVKDVKGKVRPKPLSILK